jgi:hypothetical protein
MSQIEVNEYDEVFQMNRYETVRLQGEDFGVAYLIDGIVFMLTKKVLEGGQVLPVLKPMTMSEDEREKLVGFCIDNGHEEYESSTFMQNYLKRGDVE